MKLISKEALILGGLYSVLETPFYFIKNLDIKIFGDLIGSLFFINLLLLYLPKFSAFLNKIIQHYPRVSYYLLSMGWVIYFTFVGIIFIPLLAVGFDWQDGTFELVNNIFSFICNWGALISLIIAFIKKSLIHRGLFSCKSC